MDIKIKSAADKARGTSSRFHYFGADANDIYETHHENLTQQNKGKRHYFTPKNNKNYDKHKT